jgi:hypothetical protein
MSLYVVSSDSDTPVHPISTANLDAFATRDPGIHSEEVNSCSPSTRSLADQDKTVQDDDPDWVKEFTPSRSLEPRASAPSRSRRGTGARRDLRALEAVDDDDDCSGLDSIEMAEAIGTQLMSKVTCTIEETQNLAPASQKPPPTHAGKAKSSLPLIAAPKLDQNLVLVQAQADAFDLSGDVGAVGRVTINHSGVFLDVKGVLYSCSFDEINTVCVVAVGDDDARITAVLDEALTLHQDQTIFNSGEHLVSGVLEEDDVVDGALGSASGSTALRSTSGQRKHGNPKAARILKAKPKPRSNIVARPRSRSKPKVKK